MRLLITGSRSWGDVDYIWRVLDEEYRTSLGIALHHGKCYKGADAIAEDWATCRKQEGCSILVRHHPAVWRTEAGVYDPGAGLRRNAEMVKVFAPMGGKCLAFIASCSKVGCRKPQPHGSHGATECALMAEAAGIPVVRHYRQASAEVLWSNPLGVQLSLFDDVFSATAVSS